MICSKCNGKGFIPSYIYEMNDGRCWRCSGTGKIEKKSRKQKQINKAIYDLEQYKKEYKNTLENKHVKEEFKTYIRQNIKKLENKLLELKG